MLTIWKFSLDWAFQGQGREEDNNNNPAFKSDKQSNEFIF